jgi:TonB family protein
MNTLEASLLTYLLNSFWQVPLIYVAAWLAARLSRRAGPAFQHRLWVSALFVEVLLPACSVQPAAVLRALQHWLSSLIPGHLPQTAQVTVTMGDIRAAESGLHLPPALLATAVFLYLGSLIFFAAKLGLRILRTIGLRRRTQPLTLTGDARHSFQRYKRLFGVPNAQVATSAEIAGPMTLGIRRALLLLPAAFVSGVATEDLDAAFAHEFAHIRRRDFTKNLLYKALSLPATFHPLLWLTHNRIAESRELLCDSMAAEVVAGRQRYARSLLRLASRFPEQAHPETHAIGIFDANHFKNFERRIMHLTNNPIELKGARRLATATICLALLCAACTSALAFRMQVVAPSIQDAPHIVPDPAPQTLAVPRPTIGEPPPTIVVDIPSGAINGPQSSGAPTQGVSSPKLEAVVRLDNVNVRAKIDANVRATVRTAVIDAIQTAPDNTARISAGVMAGNRLTFVPPIYPQAAKDAKLDGIVVLDAIIGKDGTITSLKLISGPDELAKSAWDAVKQWTYKPYLLNGDPVAVETTITVNFSLQK